jgi:hypothetical protein
MDFTYYQDKFQKAADQLDKKLLNKKQIEVAVGIVLNAVFLKLYKKAWANKSPDPLSADSRIFFSVWINDPAIREHKIFYNIHALKLRQLNGYSITSREFAEKFRTKFRNVEQHWPNVSVRFGPLTLMQGWQNAGIENFEGEILKLANQFLKIDHLIDNILKSYEQP